MDSSLIYKYTTQNICLFQGVCLNCVIHPDLFKRLVQRVTILFYVNFETTGSSGRHYDEEFCLGKK
jgi:hypothetical protein